jgi:hypothetical protein
MDEIEEFFTGSRSAPEQDRMLLTILFTDILVDGACRGAGGCALERAARGA